MPTADYSSFKQPANTAADGTKFDNLIDAIQTTVNGLDTNNLAAAAGVKAAQLADPGAGKVLGSAAGACADVYPPGYTINYTQITAPVTIASTTEATGTTIIAPGAVTFDGAAVLCEFFAPAVSMPTNAAGDSVIVSLFEGATQIGRLALAQTPSVTGQMVFPFFGRLRFTPTVGAHTYTVTARATSTVGSPSAVAVRAGLGGTADYVAAYVQFTKV